MASESAGNLQRQTAMDAGLSKLDYPFEDEEDVTSRGTT